MSTTGEQEKPTIAELQADIERNREDLAETVEALTGKLDVKGRTQARLAETRQQAAERLAAGRTRATELAGRARSAATSSRRQADPGRPRRRSRPQRVTGRRRGPGLEATSMSTSPTRSETRTDAPGPEDERQAGLARRHDEGLLAVRRPQDTARVLQGPVHRPGRRA